MEITYELTEEDYLQFNLYHVKHSATAVKSLKWQRFLTPVFFLVIAYLFSVIGEGSAIFSFIVFGVFGIIWVVYYPKYFYRVVGRQTKKMLKEGKNDGILGKQQMMLSQEGIIHVAVNRESRTQWMGIQKIVEDNDYFYLYNSAVSAYILPKRAVANVREVKAYIDSKLK